MPEQYAQYSDNYIPNTGISVDVFDLYRQEVTEMQQDGAYMGIWQIFQTANVIMHPIHSVFPNIGNANVITDLNCTVYCIDNTQYQMLY